MIQMKKAFFAVALLVSMSANAHYGRSFFLGANVGNIAGGGLHEQAGRTHLFDNNNIYGSFNAHMEYNSSFNASRLGEYLSPIANDAFKVGAKATAAGSTTNVANFFFLLDDAYAADITFKPKSSTFTSNLNLFVGLDEWVEGLWLDFNLPIVHNKRHVKITEVKTSTTDNTTFADNTFEDTATAGNVPYTSFTAAMVGDKGIATNIVAGNMNFGKINGSRSTTKVGNFTAALGYDVMNKENMHLGVALLGLVNGNGKSDAVYMFEPSVGTGGRHGLGGRVNGHVRLYEKDDMEFNLYLNADVVHLFDATVKRTYDLTTKHGVWSRYIIFKEGTTAAFAALATNGLVHGVNFTTLQAKVGMDVMYNVDLVLGYTNGSLGVNVGYGLFGHSKEEHKSWVDAFTTKFYGALDNTNANMDAANDNEAISTNVKIDGGNGSLTTPTAIAPAAGTIVVLADLDKNSAMNPSAMVHRVHGDVNYRWEDNEWAPHVGAGAGAEFGSNNAALRQWGVHAHFGICF